MGTVDDLFRAEFARLVRALSVAASAELAADAVQEAFIEADLRWRTVSRYDDPAGWVRRVALHRLLNAKRNERRRQEILDAVHERPRADHTDEVLDLRRGVAALPRQQRIAVCLHYLAGYSVAEVADAMGIATGTVKGYLFDARARLRLTLVEVDDA